jgi:hypothetical protein
MNNPPPNPRDAILHVTHSVPYVPYVPPTSTDLAFQALEAWEEQFGEGACDCRPEPQNRGHCCVWCQIRALNRAA